MKPTLACDVSEFQVPVTDDYPHPILSARVDTGWRTDYHAALNWRWAKTALRSGKIHVLIAYVVFIPGQNDKILRRVRTLFGDTCPAGVVFMIDMESGADFAGGGNHSAQANQLAQAFAAYAGSRKRVAGYANGGDWARCWPSRPMWMQTFKASYGSIQPSMLNMIGWQYSDGQSRWPVPRGYPRSTKPFGRCDHNVFPGLTPAQVADAFGVGAAPTVPARPKPSPTTPATKPVPTPAVTPTVPKENDMALLVSTTVNTPKKDQAVYLLDAGTLTHVSTPTDAKAFAARLGPAIPITESQFAEFGGTR